MEFAEPPVAAFTTRARALDVLTYRVGARHRSLICRVPFSPIRETKGTYSRAGCGSLTLGGGLAYLEVAPLMDIPRVKNLRDIRPINIIGGESARL